MIAILYAMEKECRSWMGTPLPQAGPIPCYPLPGGHILALCGVGKVNAALGAQWVVDKFHPAEIWNAGCAGCLHPWPVGTLVVGEHCVQHDVDTSICGDRLGFVSTVEKVEFPCVEVEQTLKILRNADLCVQSGIIATGDWFGRDLGRAAWVRDTFHADLVDMEACAVAQVCLRNQVPFRAVKVASDHLFSPAQGEEYAHNLPAAMAKLDAGIAALLAAYQEGFLWRKSPASP